MPYHFNTTLFLSKNVTFIDIAIILILIIIYFVAWGIWQRWGATRAPSNGYAKKEVNV